MRKPTYKILAAQFLGLAFSTALLTASLRADNAVRTESNASRFAIAAEVGTAGFGPAIVFTASKHFTASLGYTWFNFDYDTTLDDVDYTAKLKLSNIQAIVNWHPFAGTFHLSAGAFISNNKIATTAKPVGNQTFDLGDAVYTASQVGTLTGDLELAKGAVPYVGFGWGKNPSKGGLGFFANIGVLFTPSAKAALSATGPISTNATFRSDLRKEEADLNKDLEPLRYYPVAQMGLIYRF